MELEGSTELSRRQNKTAELQRIKEFEVFEGFGLKVCRNLGTGLCPTNTWAPLTTSAAAVTLIQWNLYAYFGIPA